MSTHFTNAEWAAIQAAPHWILAALGAADGRSGAIKARKEKLAMMNVLKEAETDNDLVRSTVDADDADEAVGRKATYADAKAALANVNKILNAKVGREDGDEYRDFLMDVANQIAMAVKEGFGLKKDPISEEEAAAIADLGNILEATAGHKLARRNAEKADAAAKAKAAAAKRAAAARAKSEREARAKLESESEARDKAHEERIATAKKRAAARKKAEAAAAARKAEQDKKAKAAAEKARQRIQKAREDAMRRAKVAKNDAAAKKAAEAAAAKAAAEAAAAAFMAEHTVGNGDTLSGIAHKYYGSGVRSNWMAIYEANKETIGKNPGMIFPGQVLKIPNLD